MFAKIAVGYDESPEAGRALATAIRLAKALGSELRAITIKENPPAYASYATAADSVLAWTLDEDQQEHYEALQAMARKLASRDGVELVTHLLEGGIH